ncbi:MULTISPECIES: hypothetical protein [Cytobacillus]|uniref:GIY-YIG domain-containing protein n=1 Tax=Cytobacillus oceanisediminis TaxID=665099 RepID=A0ABX3CNN7_9BACI|nr:hypothetical protein [Cytobacillus oceanisediminis]EFV75006.1 hypothetical protein HMPREF1013_04779 [Bacillus sp. 2_A_57_CT2]OHX45040.1 hypothetical protein BBV17_24255 [Cytobacillus oceanisediminis]
MYGTIIQDAYKKDEALEIIEALDDLCSPNDHYGWASAGLYCFWNYETKEILYIGLTLDLTQRFKQHNGYMRTTKTGSKLKNIQEYFKNHEKIGYSILVQSPLDQPVTAKNIYNLFQFDPSIHELKDFSQEQSKINLKTVEGILIEAYRRYYGSIPPWNKVEGSKRGREMASDGNYELVELFKTDDSSPLVSRFSLRQLSNEPLYEGIEIFLHGARQIMLSRGLPYGEALEYIKITDSLKRLEQIKSMDYYNIKLKI